MVDVPPLVGGTFALENVDGAEERFLNPARTALIDYFYCYLVIQQTADGMNAGFAVLVVAVLVFKFIKLAAEVAEEPTIA